MKKEIPVYGMHCKSCELLIENEVSKIGGVKVKNICQNKNILEVEVENDDKINDIKNVIKNLGYDTIDKKNKKNTIFDYFIILLLFIIFSILYLLFKDIEFFNNLIKTEKLSFLVILLIGFVASLSTCLAVTGGIVIGFSKYIDNSKDTYSHLKTQINFHIGRILGFALFGGILGTIGGYLGNFLLLNKILLLLAGIFMIYMGLNILNIVPPITKFGINLPKSLTNKILNIKNPVLAPIVGVLTFFLPCGFTQSMQIYAISSGSFLSGSLIMGAFALGTTPVLFLLGFGSSYFKDKNFDFVNKVIGVIVVFFGIIILNGFNNLIDLKNNSDQNTNSKNIYLEQKTVYHNGWSLEEKEIYLEAGKNYKLNIIPRKNGIGCMTTLTIPGIDNKVYKIIQSIPISINIVNIKPGRYNIVCSSMGMKQGEIIIK